MFQIVFNYTIKSYKKNPVRVTKADKEFADKFDLERRYFLVIVKAYHKIQTKNNISIVYLFIKMVLSNLYIKKDLLKSCRIIVNKR